MTGIQRQLAAAALTAAERGWRVFPLRPDDKRPAVRDWQERATCDPARVRDCWASGSYNVGIACGPSGLVVVDLDVPKEDDGTHPGAIGRQARSGYDALTELAHRRGEVVPAETYTVTTRSGGTHLYFRAPAGEPLRNSAGRIGRLVDTRADGGYVVGAGSVVGGRPYRVTRYSPVAELPTWLAEAARPPRSTGTAPGGSVADLRHESGYAAAALRAEVELQVTGPKPDSAQDNDRVPQRQIQGCDPPARPLPRRAIRTEGPLPRRPQAREEPAQPHWPDPWLEVHPEHAVIDLRRPPGSEVAKAVYPKFLTDPDAGMPSGGLWA